MKIGVFGGTFNPIHYGHLRAAEEAREMLSLDRVLFIPSGNPPLKSAELAEASMRLEMVRLAIAGNPFFEVLDIECSSQEKSYTVNTLESLSVRYQDARLHFMLGIDAFLDIPNWWEPDRLMSVADFIVLSRPGSRFADLFSSPYVQSGKDLPGDLDRVPGLSKTVGLKTSRKAALVSVTPIAISSTRIRHLIRQGSSIKYLLPAHVESFIISKKLYAP